MCLGLPAKIIEINKNDPLMMPATVDFGGVCKTISLSLTPQAKVGDYVLVHVGFAISIIDQAQAQALVSALSEESYHEVP